MLKPTFSLLITLPLLMSALSSHAAKLPRSPEQETLALSKLLKPISDEDWTAIAGDKISQSYSIAKGDSLYDISKRLFGDGKYWPKLWALNNSGIGNAHLIFPGNSIVFIPGTGGSLPGVAIEGTPTSDTPVSGNALAQGTPAAAGSLTDGERPYARSQEWRKLEPQPWETSSIQILKTADQYGLDRSNRISHSFASGLDIPALTASEKIEGIGTIHSAYHPGKFLSIGQEVLLNADNGEFEKGKIYAILSRNPERTGGLFSGRRGYVYPVLGKVRIKGTRENLILAQVVSASEYIERGDILIEDPGRLADLEPIASSGDLDGEVVVSTYAASFVTGQFKIAFINRGTADGVKVRNVFRVYDDYDAFDQRRITEGDYHVRGNLLVISASEEFSTCIVIDSEHPISDGSRAILLTNVDDLKGRIRSLEKDLEGGSSQDSPLVPSSEEDSLDSEIEGRPEDLDTPTAEPSETPSEEDELEVLDRENGDELAPDEKQELDQLEEFKEGEAKKPEDTLDEFNEQPNTDLDQQLEEAERTEPSEAPSDEKSSTPEEKTDSFDELLND